MITFKNCMLRIVLCKHLATPLTRETNIATAGQRRRNIGEEVRTYRTRWPAGGIRPRRKISKKSAGEGREKSKWLEAWYAEALTMCVERKKTSS